MNVDRPSPAIPPGPVGPPDPGAPVLPGPGRFETLEQVREARALADAARRRRRLLRWSAPFVAVAVLAALYLLSITVVVMVGERSFAQQSYSAATQQLAWPQRVNVLERWKPFYNAGTARYASGAFFPAQQDLEQALALVPRSPEGEPRGADECRVAINLSLALEGLGDEAAVAADHPMAISYYEQAKAQLEGCGEGGGGGEDQQQQAQESQDRQEGKQDEQQEQQDGQGEPSDPSDPTDPQDPQDPSDDPTGDEPEIDGPTEGQTGGTDEPEMTDEERELAERNRQAQEQRDREEQQQGGGTGANQGW